MTSVSISELKARLSAFRDIVRHGEDVLVTDRGRLRAGSRFNREPVCVNRRCACCDCIYCVPPRHFSARPPSVRGSSHRD